MWSKTVEWMEANFPTNMFDQEVIKSIPLPDGEVESTEIDYIKWDGNGWILGDTGCKLVISPTEHGTDMWVEKGGDIVCFLWLKDRICMMCGCRSAEALCPSCLRNYLLLRDPVVICIACGAECDSSIVKVCKCCGSYVCPDCINDELCPYCI